MFENLTPYKNYIAACRGIEEEALEESDLSGHAFMKLRFGSSRASDDILEDVQAQFDELVTQFEELKNQTFQELIALDIGMRGVMCSYALAKPYYDEINEKTSPWLEYSEWFTHLMNKVYGDGWFQSFDRLNTEKKKHLTHVVFDSGGSVVNYRLEHAYTALGALLVILLFKHSEFEEEHVLGVWDDYSEELKNPLRKGLRKHHRLVLKDKFKGTPTEFKAEVNSKAETDIGKRLKSLKKHLKLA